MTATAIVKITIKDHEIELTTEEARALVVAIESAITPKHIVDLTKLRDELIQQRGRQNLEPFFQPSPGHPFGPPITCTTQES